MSILKLLELSYLRKQLREGLNKIAYSAWRFLYLRETPVSGVEKKEKKKKEEEKEKMSL